MKLSHQSKKGRLYALVLTPTRELAIQVRNHLQAVAKYTGIKVRHFIKNVTLGFYPKGLCVLSTTLTALEIRNPGFNRALIPRL